MVKSIYQLPPRTRMELLHSNIWWSEGVELNKGFTYDKGFHLFRQGIRVVDDISDSNMHNTISWEDAQKKFKLRPTEEGDWKELMDKVNWQWSHLLQVDLDESLPGQWLGFYVDGEENPAIVFQCDTSFTPQCMHWHNATLPFSVQCYTVGTHSRCLRAWERPLGELEGLFH